MNWAAGSYQFTAAAAATTLTFTSQTAGAFGPALDNVDVQAIPEPGSALLAALGLLVMAWRRRAIRILPETFRISKSRT
jgi:hypothetical protein